MAYVYEALSDEDWKELVRLHPDGPYPSGRPSDWLNDRERDIQFVNLGGRGNAPEWYDVPPSYYVFIWRKQVIRLESRYTSQVTGDKNNQETITQGVLSICAPTALAPEQQAIRDEIPRALLADWKGLSSFNILAVHVTLSPIHFN